MSVRFGVVLGSLLLAGCGAGSSGQADRGASKPAESGEPTNVEPREPPPAMKEQAPVRVLVTGFNDWKDIDSPEAIWRCRDNPSCRLLLGAESVGEPTAFAGPLVGRLERGAPEIEWSFRTLPVTWGVFSQVPDGYDVIINIGLGVYDRFDAVQLERGAYNLHAGDDAAGVGASGAIDSAKPEGEVLMPPPGTPILGRLAALAGTKVAGFEVLVANARTDNSYLCNETHWFSLASLSRGEGAAREAYFLHIPNAGDGGFEPLADAVAGVVLALVGA